MIACISDMGSGFETAEVYARLPLPHLMTRKKATRMGNRIDLTNQRFGKLVAEEWVPKYKGSEGRWKCRCDCGNISYVPTYHLRCGNTKSCGCGRIDSARKKKPELRSYQGAYTESHRPRLYWTWLNMIRRCENPKAPDYHRYGAIGISVCEEWHDLPAFLNWAYSNGWQEGLTLDRIDNDGEYCPANCRWADRYTQGNNKRTNVFLELNGERHTVTEWSRIINLSPNVLYGRMKSGWPVEDILTKPLREQKKKVKS